MSDLLRSSCRCRQIVYGMAAIWMQLFLIVRADDPAKDAAKPGSNPASAQPQRLHIGEKTGESWSGNSLKMEFLWCPPGKFVMGSPPDEPDRVADEDQVDVEFTKGFWLGKYEVTQEQWRTVMKTEPWIGQIRVRIAPDSPACWLNWDSAHLFCRELTLRERSSGKLPEDWEYVLPTEAQWEYACRAGTTTRFSFGDDVSKLFDYAWYGEQQREPKEMNARAVGKKKPNPWGFYDMHGNVVEWTRDWYTPNYPGGKDPFVGTDENHKVTLRGGEWRREQNWARSAVRQNLSPAGTAATIGLRVVLQQANTQPSGAARTKVAVVSFENTGAAITYERLGSALAGMVASNLSKLAAIDVMERQSAKDLLNEAALAKQNITEGSSAGGNTKAADFVLTGTCSVVDKHLTVTARIERPGLPGAVAEWTLQGTVDEVFHLQEQLSQQVIEALKVDRELKTDRVAKSGQSPVMAILPFANNSPTARLDEMKLSLPEILQASLSDMNGVRLVERQQIDKILAEQNLTLTGQLDRQAAVQIGKLAGAERLLTGSFLELGKQIHIQTRVINTSTGAVTSFTQIVGSGDDFADLIDNLSRSIAGSLEVAVPELNQDSDRSTHFGRTLESALHSATAHRFLREGNRPKAVEAFQQALLMEPHHMENSYHLLLLLAKMQDWQAAARVGEQAMAEAAVFEASRWKQELVMGLCWSYGNLGRYEPAKDLLTKYGDLSDDVRTQLTISAADALIKARRYPEAVELMEQFAKADETKNGILRSEGLRRLLHFYQFHSTSVVGISVKEHQVSAAKAIKLYERILDACTGVQNDDSAKWSHYVIGVPKRLQTINDDNQRGLFVDETKLAEYEKRELETFSWMSKGKGDQVELLYLAALNHENAGKWEEAADAYRRFVERTPDQSGNEIRPFFVKYHDWIDKRLESQYRLASILANRLERKEEAREAFQMLVRDFGLAHFAGPDVIFQMHKLKVTPKIPSRCALVWGGNTSNLIGWRKLLAAQNYSVHGLRKGNVTIADLAPYPLVILCNSLHDAFSPSDVMALHTYVTAGGSLLVVISPTWDPAPVVLHNGLLSLFDIQVNSTVSSPVELNAFREHPITNGITSFSAFQPIAFRCHGESAVANAGENAVVVAQQFGRGRIVVAGVGQWLTPEIVLIPEMERPPQKKVQSSAYLGDFSKIRGSKPEPPLLRQTVKWLLESHDNESSNAVWQKEWRNALSAFSEAQACIYPPESRIRDWDKLPAVFDRLVANSSDTSLKEIALWTAGECLMSQGFFRAVAVTNEPVGRVHQNERSSARYWNDEVLPSDPKYFQQLVDDFHDSARFAYAKTRLADALTITDPEPVRSYVPPKAGRNISKLAAEFEMLDLKKGTYPHAWAKLELGCLYFAEDEFERAGVCFNEVAESIPNGAEKGLAILNSAYCHFACGQFDEARRRLEQASAMPNIQYRDPFNHYIACSESTGIFLQSFVVDLHSAAGSLQYTMQKREHDEEFLIWVRQHKKPLKR